MLYLFMDVATPSPPAPCSFSAPPGRFPAAAGLVAGQLPRWAPVAATLAELLSSSPKAPSVPNTHLAASACKAHAHQGPTAETPAVTAEVSLGVGGKYLLQIP